uniref:Carcinoembryonic antigen-related cell adhesion molecule 4-like n=1 Tax=Geotrypetes seraphini TaxID=260995 RepID=A0A6P8SJT5_GEOSA|nr:carcinoembryonic antigen-related cell adhesion molecule 4-like [Geotrypetes seraphini]XP_033819074.1 carcinoembryonic antigen-related cell adhesion molecule 4-like [Geotrypetes seraphini]
MEFVFCSRRSHRTWVLAMKVFILTVLLNLGIRPCSANDFQIDLSPRLPKEGEKVLMSLAFGDSIQRVTWYKESQIPENIILIYDPSRNVTEPGLQFTGREKAFPSGSLEISDIQRSDIGKYIIIMTLIDRNLQSMTFLNIMGSPSQGSHFLGLPIWASILIGIVAIGVVAAVIIGVVLLCRRHRSSMGTSANNEIRKPPSHYENYQQQRPLPVATHNSSQSASAYMDLKYSTSSVYEELP